MRVPAMDYRNGLPGVWTVAVSHVAVALTLASTQPGRRTLNPRRVVHNQRVESLATIRAALEAVPDQDLDTLRATMGVAPNAVPGLLAYLDHAVGWELDRRAGQSYALHPPRAAIPDDEVAASLDALAVLAIFFRRDRQHDGEAIAALLDQVALFLRADLARPDTLH